MNHKLIFASVILIVTLINQTLSEPNHVVVSLVQYHPSNMNNSTFRCSGAIIAPQHVITIASCVLSVQLPLFLGVRLFHKTSEGLTIDLTTTVVRMNIHPDYERQPREANIAVVRVR